MSFLFPILLLVLGLYVLVGAIKGEGKLFSLENFKDDSKEKARKIMRIIYFALAAIMLLMALTNGAQSLLYGNTLTYHKITEAYKEAFPDMIDENGFLVGHEGDAEYNVSNEKMTQAIAIGGFIQDAYNKYGTDTSKFPQVSGGGLSCMSSTIDYEKYYKKTNLIKVVNGEDIPLYDEKDTDQGEVVYCSTYGNVRSDANDGSFLSKLYGFCSQKLLTVLNYVFLGLAVIAVVGLFLVSRKYTDKEKLAKARAQQTGQSMPSSAFDFSDDDSKKNA